MRYLALVALLAACHHAAASSGGSPPAARLSASGDTLRGTVAIVGATPLTQLVLRPADGGRAVTLTGDSALLRSVVGLDVVARGSAGAKSFLVSSLRVQSVGGVLALDGVVRSSSTGPCLELESGICIRLTAWPPELAARTGSRAWVTTSTDATVISFGWIPTPPASPR